MNLIYYVWLWLDIDINPFDSVDLYGCGPAHQLMAPNIESAICQD